MKTMKLILMIVFLIVANTTFAQQHENHKGKKQGPPPPPVPTKEQMQERLNHLTKELSLTEVQKKSIQKLEEQHLKDVKEKICSSDDMPPKEEMEVLRKEHDQMVKEILTDEQKVKFDELLKKQRKQKPKHCDKG